MPLTLLRDELAQRLDQQRISQRFLAGPVNICTLMPMRSIPFKVVCLLGMNDGVYPRTLPPLGFDLMSQKPQRGDRSRRDDDRYLFLEALMSAEQTLYISYIGRSIQDNSERFPSVLVQELVDYIGQSHCLAGDEELDCDASEARVKAHITHLHTRMPFLFCCIGIILLSRHRSLSRCRFFRDLSSLLSLRLIYLSHILMTPGER